MPNFTKETLAHWLNNNTRVRHKNIIKPMAIHLKPWFSVSTLAEIDIITEHCFDGLTSIAKDKTHFGQKGAINKLNEYKDTVSNALTQVRAVAEKENCDIDYLTALTQSVLKHAPTNKASFKKWLESNAERIFNETFPASLWNFSNNFKRYNPALSKNLRSSLFKLKTDFTQIAEEHALLADNSEIVEQTKMLDSRPAKQFNAAFRSVPSDVLEKIIFNIVSLPQVDRTQLEITIKKILSKNKINPDFLTKSHIGQAWKLKEQVRELSDTNVRVNSHITVGSGMNIAKTVAKSAVITTVAHAASKSLDYGSAQEWGQSIYDKTPAMIVPTITAQMLFRDKIIKLMGPKLTSLFLKHTRFRSYATIAGLITPSFITNFFGSFVPAFLSNTISTIDSTLSWLNPFSWASSAMSHIMKPAAEVILDDESVLPLVAFVSLLAVVAYRSPELKYLYTKLKNSLLEYTGESEENWNEFEEEFKEELALDKPDTMLLLSGGHQLDDSIRSSAPSKAKNDDVIIEQRHTL